MNHTSGLPRYIFRPAFLTDLRNSPLKPRNPHECLSVLLDVSPVHPVGEGWSYSDSNYIVLGLIIEEVTGSTYYEELTRRVIDRFRLTNTQPSTQPDLPGLVLGHMAERNPFGLPARTIKNGRYVLNPMFEWCGGGLISNVDDLARWQRLLHSGQVLDPDVYRELVRPSTPAARLPDGAKYGLGTFLWQTEVGPCVGHAGMMPGYLTQIEYSPKHGIGIALQTNTDQRIAARLHSQVLRFAKIAAP